MTDLEELTAEVLRLKELGVGSVRRVVLFGAGLVREGEFYTRPDIAQVVRNFAALSSGPAPPMPVVIGLDHAPGGPAVGRVPRLWQEPGGVLCCSFADLPLLWARAVRKGLWFRVSAELEPEPPFGLPGEGWTLTGVTLLGRDRPQLKWTSHLQELVNYAERRGLPPRRRRFWVERGAGRRRRVFSEAVTMADSDMKTALVATLADKPVPLPAEWLEKLPDDLLTELSEVVNPAAAEEGGGEEGMQETFDREQTIARILELDPSQDRAALEAMSDDELQALLAQLEGGAGEGFSETDAGGGAGEGQGDAGANGPAAGTTHDGGTAVTTAAKPPAGAPAQFSELDRRMREAEARLARINEAAKRREFAEKKRADAEHDRRVLTDLGRLRDAKIVAPKHVSKDSVLFRYLRALDHGTARKFADGHTGTEYERELRRLEADGPDPALARLFGEKVAHVDSGRKAAVEQIRADTARHYEALRAQRGLGLHERLNSLPPRALR